MWGCIIHGLFCFPSFEGLLSRYEGAPKTSPGHVLQRPCWVCGWLSRLGVDVKDRKRKRWPVRESMFS
jgi:hypothetical protein